MGENPNVQINHNRVTITHNIMLFGGYSIGIYTVALIVVFIVNRPLFVLMMYAFLIGVPVLLVLGALVGLVYAIVHIHTKIVHKDVKYYNDFLAVREGRMFNKQWTVHHKDNPQSRSVTVKEIPQAAPILQLPAPQPPQIDTFNELLRAGVVQQVLDNGKFIIGYSIEKDGTAVMRMGTWKELYSCAVAGVSGAGKTTTVLFLLYQAILCGTKLIMVDPHMGDEDESLAARLVGFERSFIYPPCDDTTKDVLIRVHWLRDELERRKKGADKRTPIIAVFDEINALMRKAEIKDELSELIVSIAEEGRKFGIFALLSGQRWASQEIGNKSAVRGALASVMVHRLTDINQIKLLMGSGKYNDDVLSLPQGHHLFRDTSGGLVEMVTPYTNDEDGELVQRLITSRSTSQPLRSHFTNTSKLNSGSGYGSYTVVDAEPIEVTEVDADEEEVSTVDEGRVSRVFQLMVMERLSDTKIVAKEWGVTSGGKFTQGMNELKEIKQLIERRAVSR